MLRRDRGAALILALLTLLVLTVLGLALTSRGMVALAVATSDREGAEALYLADSGIAHATALILSEDWPSFDGFLRAGGTAACTGDELATTPPVTLLPYPPELIPAAGVTMSPFGSYRVEVCDDHLVESTSAAPPLLPDNDPSHDANGRILVRSTGTGRRGASATIEVALARVPLPALLVDGNLRLNGNPSVMGSSGAVHANGNLELIGSPCAQQYLSSAGTVSGGAQGGPTCTPGAADVRQGQDSLTVPDLRPVRFKPQADYLLGADGQVRNQAGSVVDLPGWTFSASDRKWRGGDTIPGGTYYAEGNVDLAGNLGHGPHTPPLPLTIVAEGWVDVTGTPNMVPALGGTPAYAIVAGTDLRLSGNPGTLYEGVFYAGDQIDFGGNPTINGQVIAKNRGDAGTPDNLVPLQGGSMAISGNVTINYNGGGMMATTVQGWRECRGPDPDRPCGAP